MNRLGKHCDIRVQRIVLNRTNNRANASLQADRAGEQRDIPWQRIPE